MAEVNNSASQNSSQVAELSTSFKEISIFLVYIFFKEEEEIRCIDFKSPIHGLWSYMEK